MTDADRAVVQAAVEILYATPYDHSHRKIRCYYADQMELQYLVGNPMYDAVVVDLAKAILEVSGVSVVVEGHCQGTFQKNPL